MKIVQIGTCVGNDDLTNIVQHNQPSILILVEPMNIHNDKRDECYSGINNLYLENIAITTTNDDETSFYYHKNDGPMYEVASNNVNHILKHGYSLDGVIEIKVKCLTINQLFEKYNLSDIDILFIDAEGLDDKIIKSIDFDKFSIDKIYFENLHLQDKKIYNFLAELNYKITHSTGFMGWSSLAEK